MKKISTIAMIVAASFALAACNAETVTAAVADLIASELPAEDIESDDIDEMAKENGGMKKFITETNGVDPTVDPSADGNKLVLTDFLAKDIWRLVNRSLHGLNAVISEQKGPFSACTVAGSAGDRYTIKSCSGVVLDENGKDMTLNFEANVVWTKDQSTNKDSTKGELYFGFYRGNDFYTIGVQNLDWIKEQTATTLDERISGDVLYVSRDQGVVSRGYVKIETPQALSSPDTAGDREFNAGYVKIKDVNNNSFDLTYYGNIDDPSISIGN